jgi:N-acyl homoserine lactone hydrolase
MKKYYKLPLVIGANETDQWVITCLRDYGKRIRIPVYVFYTIGRDKNILADNGFEQFVIQDHVGEACGSEVMQFEEDLSTADLSKKLIDIILPLHDLSTGKEIPFHKSEKTF